MLTLIRKPLKSSKLRAAGYDEGQRVMHIEFVNGDIFQYTSVSPELYRQLMASPSANSFFEDKIEEAFSGKRIGKVTLANSNCNSNDAFDGLFGAKPSDDEAKR